MCDLVGAKSGDLRCIHNLATGNRFFSFRLERQEVEMFFTALACASVEHHKKSKNKVKPSNSIYYHVFASYPHSKMSFPLFKSELSKSGTLFTLRFCVAA